MTILSEADIANWIALYAAAGLCCAIAVVLSVGTAAVELHRERAWEDLKTVKGFLMFAPKTWWRWQKLYFLSTPVTLAIVGSFAATLSWA